MEQLIQNAKNSTCNKIVPLQHFLINGLFIKLVRWMANM